MKTLGFKTLLLVSVLALVAISVSSVSYVLYQAERDALVDQISSSTKRFVKNQAKLIQNEIDRNTETVHRLALHYKSKDITGDYVEKVTEFAAAAATSSMTITLNNGDSYWNQTGEGWANNKSEQNELNSLWYTTAQNANGLAVTTPYGDANGYWISMVEKTKNAVIALDFEVNTIQKMVEKAVNMPGAVALVMAEDSSALSSTSPKVKLGAKLNDYPDLRQLARDIIGKDEVSEDYQLFGVDKLVFSKKIKVGQRSWYLMIALDKKVTFSRLEEVKTEAIITVIISILVSTILAYFILQYLYRPIISLKKTVIDLSSGNGDLTQRLEVKTDDDLGQLAKGINQFIENLQSMMLEIQGASDHLQENIVSLKQQTDNSAATLQSHVMETEQVVAAVEEMNATSESVAANAAEAATFTEKANQTGKASRLIIDQSQLTVTALVDEVESATKNVQQMSEETQSINSVLSMIGAIAEQTNLLALNAAIEAARAGEQGRGFAVVADEVRNLASRTKASTSEIEQALEKLLRGNQSVVEAMTHTRNRCQETAAGTVDVSDSLESMNHLVSEINNLSTQIATAAEEQSNVTHEVSRNMSAISGIVGELNATGRETVSQTENIAAVNNQLAAIVRKFKLA